MRQNLSILIFGLAGFALLAGLGIWQVQRAGWKGAVLARIDSRITADPVPLPIRPDPQADRYLAVTVSGEMLAGEVPVLVSRRQFGAGYRIIAPMRLDDGRMVLIDRGFVPAVDHHRARALGPMIVTGNLHWPDEVDGFTPEPDRKADIWFARDVPALAGELGTEPVLVIARSRTDDNIAPLPVDSAGIPNDHLNYAVTWFGLALVWAAMTVLFMRRRARGTGE